MSNFLEVIPGVCISTRRIVSIEVQEDKNPVVNGYTDARWLIIVFTDIHGEDGKPIVYVYNHQIFSDKEAAMVKLGEIVGQCSADA